MTETPMDILKARLARGEISVEEYQRLYLLLRNEYAPARSSLSPEQQLDCGRPVAGVDDLILCERALKYQGDIHALDAVQSVRGGQDRSTVNGITAHRHTYLRVILGDGTQIEVAEGRAWRGGKRHDAILETLRQLQQLTLASRCDYVWRRLAADGSLRLTTPGLLARDPAYLYSDGSIGNSRMRVGIREAHLTGTLVFGHSQGHYPASSYSPDDIVISDKKAPKLLALPLTHKIVFTVNELDPDVVRAIISWYAAQEAQ